MKKPILKKVATGFLFGFFMLSLQIEIKKNLDGDLTIEGVRSSASKAQYSSSYSQMYAETCYSGPYMGQRITCPIGFTGCAPMECNAGQGYQ